MYDFRVRPTSRRGTPNPLCPSPSRNDHLLQTAQQVSFFFYSTIYPIWGEYQFQSVSVSIFTRPYILYGESISFSLCPFPFLLDPISYMERVSVSVCVRFHFLTRPYMVNGNQFQSLCVCVWFQVFFYTMINDKFPLLVP